jgi:ribosomal-protein-alanine N-acetyltransferase
MRIDPFETERLIHRPLALEDLAVLAPLYADSETMRWIGSGRVRSRDETEKDLAWSIEHYRREGVGLFATVEKSTSQVVGRCGFTLHNEGSEQELALDYLIARTRWDRGYATEAAAGMLAQAALHLAFAFPHAVALIQPGNSRAINVARNVGMTFWELRMLGALPAEAYRKLLK